MRPYLENRTSARDVNCLFSFPLGWCGARVWHRGRWLWWMGGRWRRRSIQHREKGKNPRGGLCNRNCCSEGCRRPAVELAVMISDKWFTAACGQQYFWQRNRRTLIGLPKNDTHVLVQKEANSWCLSWTMSCLRKLHLLLKVDVHRGDEISCFTLLSFASNK